MMRMKVFVTDGNQRSTLAVVRALGQSGAEIHVGEAARKSLAGVSRYTASQVEYPQPETDSVVFQHFLLTQLRHGSYDVLLPMSDVTLNLIACMRPQLPIDLAVPIPTTEQIARAHDKRELIRLAGTLGIPVPATLAPDDLGQIENLSRQIQYPAIVKPRFSRFREGGTWRASVVEIVRNRDELLCKYRAMHDVIPLPLIQDRLEGQGVGVFVLLWDGSIKAAFAHRRLREKPPWGGVSVLCESVPLDQKLFEQSVCLLKTIGWQGVAMVEYKIDHRDDVAKLMEVNGRFWGSLQLAIDAGVNFPVLLCQALRYHDSATQLAYKIGVRSRWLLGDLDNLLIRLRRQEENNGTSRWSAIGEFLQSDDATRCDVMRREDSAPAWFELQQWVRSFLRSRPDKAGPDAN